MGTSNENDTMGHQFHREFAAFQRMDEKADQIKRVDRRSSVVSSQKCEDTFTAELREIEEYQNSRKLQEKAENELLSHRLDFDSGKKEGLEELQIRREAHMARKTERDRNRLARVIEILGREKASQEQLLTSESKANPAAENRVNDSVKVEESVSKSLFRVEEEAVIRILNDRKSVTPTLIETSDTEYNLTMTPIVNSEDRMRKFTMMLIESHEKRQEVKRNMAMLNKIESEKLVKESVEATFLAKQYLKQRKRAARRKGLSKAQALFESKQRSHYCSSSSSSYYYGSRSSYYYGSKKDDRLEGNTHTNSLCTEDVYTRTSCNFDDNALCSPYSEIDTKGDSNLVAICEGDQQRRYQLNQLKIEEELVKLDEEQSLSTASTTVCSRDTTPCASRSANSPIESPTEIATPPVISSSRQSSHQSARSRRLHYSQSSGTPKGRDYSYYTPKEAEMALEMGIDVFCNAKSPNIAEQGILGGNITFKKKCNWI